MISSKILQTQHAKTNSHKNIPWEQNNKWFPGMETELQFSLLTSDWIKKRLKLVKVNQNTNPKNIKKIQVKEQENNKTN